MEPAQVEADQTFHSILTAGVTALPQLALKLRAMMQREKDAMHSHGGDDGTVGNYAMLAADLDCLITMQDAGGKGGAVMKPLSDRDSAILAQHSAGALFKEVAEALKVGVETVRRIVEHVGPIHTKGRELLAADPESLEELRLTGSVSERAYSAIANATYTVDVPEMERLSDIAAQGRECVARFPKIGPAVMAELDAVLARFGIAWNPRPRPFAYRTDENRHPLLRLWDRDRGQSYQEARNAEHWNDIVRRVATIERAVGTAILENIQAGTACRAFRSALRS